MKTLKGFLDQRKILVAGDQNAFGAYCHAAFFLEYIGALVCEKDSDKTHFKYRRSNEDTIFVNVLNPNNVEVVSELPLALRKEGSGGGFVLYKGTLTNNDYHVAERQLRMVGLS